MEGATWCPRLSPTEGTTKHSSCNLTPSSSIVIPDWMTLLANYRRQSVRIRPRNSINGYSEDTVQIPGRVNIQRGLSKHITTRNLNHEGSFAFPEGIKLSNTQPTPVKTPADTSCICYPACMLYSSGTHTHRHAR